MDVIKQAAERYLQDFYLESKYMTDPEKSILDLRDKLNEYQRDSHKVSFLQYMIENVQFDYTDHLQNKCTCPDTPEKCGENQFYEAVLFHMREDLSLLMKGRGAASILDK